MKIGKYLIAAGACIAFTGIAQAGPTSPQAVVKTIRLTAHIGDSLFVSTPGDSAAYGVVELTATDGSPQTFGATLPIRVYTTNPDIRVALLQPLKLSNGRYGMTDAKVVLADKAGGADIAHDGARTLTLVKPGINGYDETRTLTISANAPATRGAAGVNGSYRGDLVLMFEPVASAGDDAVPGGRVVAADR
ncbi:fimbrial assembly protein [Burkholderia aenigmatica]|uniref:Fimbrial assembly protein n=1 Tax=Burkholderia aenigmatica TaxID=2015348 RepID=A0A228IMI9_9BURK|nr:fimbrial assembly protein [Burkholderia aenigmatica]OXI43610.1 fimbrial assembly protein [Burkholderia aenigmatica]